MKKLSFALALLLLLSSCFAASKPVTLSVTVSAVLVSNDHLGSEWAVDSFINGVALAAAADLKTKKIEDFVYIKDLKKENVVSRDTVRAAAGDTLQIVTEVTEYDKDYCDFERVLTEHTVIAAELRSGFTVEVPVTVTETGGRYSGKTASWVITYQFAP